MGHQGLSNALWMSRERASRYLARLLSAAALTSPRSRTVLTESRNRCPVCFQDSCRVSAIIPVSSGAFFNCFKVVSAGFPYVRDSDQQICCMTDAVWRSASSSPLSSGTNL